MQTPGIDMDAFHLFASPNLTGTPERNLLLAVLERAILDFVGNEPKERERARQWIFGDLDKPAEAFTFPWVCAQLDLNHFNVAGKIKAMPRRGRRRVAPWYFQRQEENRTLLCKAR